MKITSQALYGECTERLTAFGGLLALVKFLDLIGFEKRFEEHYVHLKREPKLGGYRMVMRRWARTPSVRFLQLLN